MIFSIRVNIGGVSTLALALEGAHGVLMNGFTTNAVIFSLLNIKKYNEIMYKL